MRKNFEQLAIIDVASLTEPDLERLSKLSQKTLIIHPHPPKDIGELVQIIKGADGLIASLLVELSQEVLTKCLNLRYLGVYGTSTRRVDLKAAKEAGIVVTNIQHYCDRETAEFVLAEVMCLARGIRGPVWKQVGPVSLAGRTIGIIGMGNVGTELALMCLSLGMKVIYFSPRRNAKIETAGASYQPFHALLAGCEIISIHVPPDTALFGAKELELIPQGTIVINTSVGPIFEEISFRKWLENRNNHVILDAVTGARFLDLRTNDKLIISERVAAITAESKRKRSHILIENIEKFLLKPR